MINAQPTIGYKRIGDNLYSFVGGDTNVFTENIEESPLGVNKFYNVITFKPISNIDDSHLAIGRIAYTTFYPLEEINFLNGYFELRNNPDNDLEYQFVKVDEQVDGTWVETELGHTDNGTYIQVSEEIHLDSSNICYSNTSTVSLTAVARSPWASVFVALVNYRWTQLNNHIVLSDQKADKFFITPYEAISSLEFKELATLTSTGINLFAGSSITANTSLDINSILEQLQDDYVIRSITSSWILTFKRNTNTIELYRAKTQDTLLLWDGTQWNYPTVTTNDQLSFGTSSFIGLDSDFTIIEPIIKWTRLEQFVDLLDVFTSLINIEDGLGIRLNNVEIDANDAFDDVTSTFIKYPNFAETKTYVTGDIVNISAPGVGNFREMVCVSNTGPGSFVTADWDYTPDNIPVRPFEMVNNDFFTLKGITFYYRSEGTTLTVTQAMIDTLSNEITSPRFIPSASENFLNSNLYMLCNWEGPGSYIMFWKGDNSQTFTTGRGPLINELDNNKNFYGLVPNSTNVKTDDGDIIVSVATDGVTDYYDIQFQTIPSTLGAGSTLFSFTKLQEKDNADIAITPLFSANIMSTTNYTSYPGNVKLDATSTLTSFVNLPNGGYRALFTLPAGIIQR